MENEKPDLTFVDPHRRSLVAERIEAVKRFNRNPGRASAEREAGALGISAGRFYLVVKAWNTYRDASRLPGANRHRMDARVPDAIREEIARLLGEDPDIIPERAIDAVTAFASATGIEAPSGPTIADELNRQRRGHFPMLEQNVNHALDHCHLAIPVASGATVSAVTLSSVIDISGGSIIGLALTTGVPDAASSARAVAHAARTGRLLRGSSILMDRPDGERWVRLVNIIDGAGFSVSGETLDTDALDHDRGVLRKRGNGRLLRAVAGRYIGGYPMVVRTKGSRSRPDPRRKAGAPSLELDEAEQLIRSRTASAPSGRVDEELARLADRLDRFAAP